MNPQKKHPGHFAPVKAEQKEEADPPCTIFLLPGKNNGPLPPGSGRSLLKTSDIKKIREVEHYISQHFKNPLPHIRELARAAGINRKKLKYGFKRLFKTTIYRYYTGKRLEEALELIKHTDLPLAEISAMTGFSTYSGFYKAFRLKYGCTPSQVERESEGFFQSLGFE